MKKKLSLLIVVVLLGICRPSLAGQATVQVQPSTEGNFEMRLIQVKQKGDVLSIQAVVKNISDKEHSFDITYKDVYYVDAKDKKKYMPLRDAQGQTIAGPNSGHSSGGYLSRGMDKGQKAIIWIKFPVPVSGTSKIDVYFPDFLPFEDVVIQNAPQPKGKTAPQGGTNPAEYGRRNA